MKTTRILALLFACVGLARAAVPTIDTQPANSTNCPGTAATFTVAASSDSSTNYQWYFNETNVIVDATNTAHVIASVSALDAGTYSVVVTNDSGSVTSVVALLVVNSPTTASSLASATVCSGANASFSTTAGGTGPFAYVWRKNGGAALGSTSNSLNLVGVIAGDAGVYSVEVTGACGSATNSATLTVNALTAATGPSPATVLSGQSVTLSTTPSGTGPFTYVWRQNGGPSIGAASSLTVKPLAVGSATYSVEVSGACNSVTNSASITVRTANIVFVSDSPATNATAHWPTTPLVGSADDNFVTFLQGAGYNVVRFSSDDAPANLLSPADIAALNTNDLVFIGRASGSGAFQAPQGNQWNTNITVPMVSQNAYLQRGSRMGWFTGTDNVPDGTPGPLTAANINNRTNAFLFGATAMNGSVMANNYDVALGLNTSHSTNPPAAGGRVLATIGFTNVIVDFRAGTVVKGTDALAGYRMYIASGNRENGISISSGAGSNNLTAAGQSIFLRALAMALNSGTPTNLGVAPYMTVQPTNLAFCAGLPATLVAAADGENPLSYQWYFNGSTPIAGGTNATLSFTFAAVNVGNYTVVVTNGVGSITSSVAAVSISGTGTIASAVANQTNCPGSSATFTTTATGTGISYTWRKGGSVVQGPNLNNSYTIPSVSAGDAGQYSVTVVGDCNTVSNSFVFVVAPAPIITAQPQNQTTPMGNGAVFAVTALTTNAGAAPLSYQWKTNGVNVTGATGSSIAISNLSLGQSGLSFSVDVTDCAGTTPSTAAILTVTPITAISFDFNTPGQYTNAPYNMANADWNNSTLINNQPFGPVVPFEVSTGGVGVATGGGGLDLMFNNGNVNSSTLHPISYDFSLPGKTLTVSLMMKAKFPLANSRAVQIGFTTATNLDLVSSSHILALRGALPS